MKALDNIKLSPKNDGEKALRKACAMRLGIKPEQLGEVVIKRRSIDARKKQSVFIIYSVECYLKGERRPEAAPDIVIINSIKPDKRPVVVGSGPAGMLCALTLAQAGTRPIILERGQPVEQRSRSVEQYFSGGELNICSNVQFGEGGAGTFSDGKLTTGVRDRRIAAVNRVFVEAGADRDIIYSAKPHIGTDRLRLVVANIRKRIESLGGEYRFSTRLSDIEIKDNRLTAAIVEREDGSTDRIDCDRLVLACGHSARDTFEMLFKRKIVMQPKPFSIGARIEHPQSFIDKRQYGEFAGLKSLGAADYKLSAHTSDGRGVYTFCMCPGGYVVAAASEQESICTNGMSLRQRDGVNANSAVLVGITPEDFGSEHPLGGMYMQRRIERAAYAYSGSSKAPAQLLGDLIEGRASGALGEVEPSYRPGVSLGEISCCLPDFVVSALREGCLLFDSRIKGFAMHDAVLTAPETRSSSPVRIVRDESLQSSVAGIYPCGEGAGYAGGIMSAAVDGIRVAEQLLEMGDRI